MKRLKQLLKEQNKDDENKQPSPILPTNNELKPMNQSDREMVSLEKHKLEVEQRVNQAIVFRHEFIYFFL